MFKRRFHFLFVALLFLYLLHPLSSSEWLGMGLLDVSFTLVLLTALFAVSRKKHITITAILLGGCGQVLTLTPYFFYSKPVVLTALGIDILFLVYTASVILFHIVRDRMVTADTIFGSLSVYLLIGFIWALIFSFIEVAQNGSFIFSPNLVHQLAGQKGKHIFAELYYLIYYSFTTLTTLGYGDIVPGSAWARVFSALEAITGQLYLVVLVSRLVGMHSNQRNNA
ncbi:MAG: potassium channel family protein [Deltaproteobacteria bacterium]|nr:potassium channel family protein [Deltaproteobacteria bacterium]